MSTIDVKKLLEPVTEDAPCGEDLEYDAAFQELERAAAPSSGASMLDDDAEVEPPKWKDIAKQAQGLFVKTKDLRAAMYLTQARLNLDGVTGLADGVSLIKGMLSEYWDEVYPLLDAEDDNDPTMRINSLHSLGNSDAFVRDLRAAPLVKAKLAGVYSLRDIQMASGEAKAPEGAESPDSSIIDAAFLECDLDELKESAEAVPLAQQYLADIENLITEKVGATNNTLTVKPLADELKVIHNIYSEALISRGVDVETEDGEESGVGGKPVSGDIRSREDAIRMMDKISEYFRRNEPSSPVPFLLNRAKGLVAKDFMEILQDLTPDAIKQAKIHTGSGNDDD